MARYYCEYCQSYLTHDTLSVRKSHLIGKHHLKYVSDYYQNKYNEQLKQESQRKTKKKRYYNKRESPPFKLVTNKQAKKNLKAKESGKILKETKKIKRDKLLDPFNMSRTTEPVLSKIYNLSPGYNNVFVPSNRFDIGELIKTSQLPQRANVDNSQEHQNKHNNRSKGNGRDTVFDSSLIYSNNDKKDGAILPPPMIIAKWSNTIPKEKIYYEK